MLSNELMVTRAEPQDAGGGGGNDPICPVCVKPIGKKDRVSGSGSDLIHEACDYARAHVRPKQPPSAKGFHPRN